MLPANQSYNCVSPLFEQNDVYTFDEGEFEGAHAIIKTYNALVGAQRTKALRESLRAFGQTNLPYFAQVQSIDEQDGRLHIVYQWLPVMPLSKLLQQRDFSIHESLVLVLGLAQAIRQMHSLGWYHGNLSEHTIHVDRYQLRPILFHLESIAQLKGSQDPGQPTKPQDAAEKIARDLRALGKVLLRLLRVSPNNVTFDTQSDTVSLRTLHRDAESKNVLPEAIQELLGRLMEPSHPKVIRRATELIGLLEDAIDIQSGLELPSLQQRQETRTWHGSFEQILSLPVRKAEEISRIRSVYSVNAQHHCCVLLVEGKPGFGKTYLLNYLHEHIFHDIDTLFVFTCSDTNNFRYKTICEYLNAVLTKFHQVNEHRLVSVQSQLRGIIEHGLIPQVLLSKIPMLRTLLGMEVRKDDDSSLADLNHDCFAALFEALIQIEPVPVCLFDDLDKADYHSLECFEHLLREKVITDGFFVATYSGSTTASGSGINLLKRSLLSMDHIDTDTIKLQPLREQDVHSFISTHLTPHASATEITSQIWQIMPGGEPYLFFKLLEWAVRGTYVQPHAGGRFNWDIQALLKAYANDLDDPLSELGIDEHLEDWNLLTTASCFQASFTEQDLSALLSTERDIGVRLQRLAQRHILTSYYDAQLDQHLFALGNHKLKQSLWDRVPRPTRYWICRRIAEHLKQQEAERGGDSLSRARYLLLMDPQFVLDDNEIPNLIRELRQLSQIASASDQQELKREIDLKILSLASALRSDFDGLLDLKVETHLDLAELSLSRGDSSGARYHSQWILNLTDDSLRCAQALTVLMQAEKADDCHSKAIPIGMQAVAKLGFKLPKRIGYASLIPEWARLWAAQRKKGPYPFSSLPACQDPRIRLFYKLCFHLGSAAYIAGYVPVMTYLMLKALRTALTHGVNTEIAPILCMFGGNITVLNQLTAFEGVFPAARYMLEAERIASRFGDGGYEPYIRYVENTITVPWKHGLALTEEPLARAYRRAMKTGHVELAGWCSGQYFAHRYIRGRDYQDLKRALELTHDELAQLCPGGPIRIHKMMLQGVTNIVNPSETPGLLQGEIFTPSNIGTLDKVDNQTEKSAFIFVQTLLSLMFRQYDKGAESYRYFHNVKNGILGQIGMVYVCAYGMICTLFESRRRNWLYRKLLSWVYAFLLNTSFRYWTRNPNQRHLYFFVEAVRQSLFGSRKSNAFYEKALSLALEKEHWKESALIAEHFALELRNQQNEDRARDYLEQAIFFYGKVGAKAKEQALRSELTTWAAGSDELNETREALLGVVSACQCISSARSHEALIQTSTDRIRSLTGASRVCMIERLKGAFFITGIGDEYSDETVVGNIPLHHSHLLCEPFVSGLLHGGYRRFVHIKDHNEVTSDLVGYLSENDLVCMFAQPVVSQGDIPALLYCEFRHEPQQQPYQILELLDWVGKQLAITLDTVQQPQRVDEPTRNNELILQLLNHELKTPLNVITGSIATIKDQASSQPVRDAAQQATAQLNHLNQSLSNLLTLAAIRHGDFELAHKPFSVKDAIEQAIREATAAAVEKGLHIDLSYDQDIPLVVGDSARLIQIITLLLRNAIKFTPKGAIGSTIAVVTSWTSVDAKRGALSIAVSDAGSGIDRRDLKNYFVAFGKGEAATTSQNDGLGLGLTLANELARLMHGHIVVDSLREIGSRFMLNIMLDYQPQESRPAVEAVAELSLPLLADIAPTLKCLVVDDVPGNLLVMQDILNGLGIPHDCVSSGAEALTRLAQRQYDLILLDLYMPELDGFQVAQIIRTEYRHRNPIILAVSADDRPSVVESAKQAGMDAFLGKPVSKQQLAELLATLLGLAESEAAQAREDTDNQRWTPDPLYADGLTNDATIGLLLGHVFARYSAFSQELRACWATDHAAARAKVHAFKNAVGAVRAMELFRVAEAIYQLGPTQTQELEAQLVELERCMQLLRDGAKDWFLQRLGNRPLPSLGWLSVEALAVTDLEDQLEPWKQTIIGDLINKVRSLPDLVTKDADQFSPIRALIQVAS